MMLNASTLITSFCVWRTGETGADSATRCASGSRVATRSVYTLDNEERAVMDAYLRERVEVRKWSGQQAERRIESPSVDYVAC
jgi:hypothetical protein